MTQSEKNIQITFQNGIVSSIDTHVHKLITELQEMVNNDEKLLKLSLLAAVYDIADLTLYCLSKFDERNSLLLAEGSSSLAEDWLRKMS